MMGEGLRASVVTRLGEFVRPDIVRGTLRPGLTIDVI
jgi:hypothetical protein